MLGSWWTRTQPISRAANRSTESTGGRWRRRLGLPVWSARHVPREALGAGRRLCTRPGGSVIVELVDTHGQIVGRSKALSGDVLDMPVAWEVDPHLKEDARDRLRALRGLLSDLAGTIIGGGGASAVPLDELNRWLGSTAVRAAI